MCKGFCLNKLRDYGLNVYLQMLCVGNLILKIVCQWFPGFKSITVINYPHKKQCREERGLFQLINPRLQSVVGKSR